MEYPAESLARGHSPAWRTGSGRVARQRLFILLTLGRETLPDPFVRAWPEIFGNLVVWIFRGPAGAPWNWRPRWRVGLP